MSTKLSDFAEYRHILAKLSSGPGLAASEADALAALPVVSKALRRGESLVEEGDRSDHSAFLLSGFAASYKDAADGQRQIIALYLAGDMPDLQSLHMKRMDQTISAMADSRFALVLHSDLRHAIRASPGLGEAFWRDTLIDAAIQREWMMGLGRKQARARIAHLFCELHLRSRAAGLSPRNSFPLPLIQSELADALGLTSVHVNRVLQDLRHDGLLSLEHGEATLLELRRLEDIADFDGAYLGLSAERPPA